MNAHSVRTSLVCGCHFSFAAVIMHTCLPSLYMYLLFTQLDNNDDHIDSHSGYVHHLNNTDEMKVTAMGASEPSFVSAKKSSGEWDWTIRLGNGEKKVLGISARDQCLAMNVWTEFENGQKG